MKRSDRRARSPREGRPRTTLVDRLPAALLAAALSGVAPAALADVEVTPDVARGGAPQMDPHLSAIDIDLTIDPDTGMIVERVTLEVRASGVSRLAFDLNPWLTIERSSADEGLVEHRKGAGKLYAFLSPAIDGTRSLSFRITGRPRRGADYVAQGNRVVLGGADAWYPSLPGTWARARVTVRAPAGWTVVAPGRREEQSEPGVWRWRTERPVRSLALAAAPGLDLVEASAVRSAVRIAAPEAQRLRDRVQAALDHPMAWLASALAPYPFDGFNLVLLPGLDRPVRGSGMLVAPLEVALDGPADGADLLAGQWFGELVAGDGVWMDSFAAWYATVYARDRTLEPPAEIADLRREYLALSPSRDVAISRADVLTPEAVVRGKGSAAPEMIRLTVGDRRTFEAVRDLFQRPVAPPLTLRDVRTIFEKHAGSTLLRSFSDWFDRTGAPEIDATMTAAPVSDGGWRVELDLVQLRGNYALPVEVTFVGRGQQHRETVHVDAERTTVTYTLPFEPVRLELDPFGKLFRSKTE